MSDIATTAPSRTSAPARAATDRLEGLQALRGLAAGLVLVLHATQFASGFGGIAWFDDAAGAIAAMGFIGVDIFFVLSGVVISILLRRNAVRAEAPGGFLARRAAKLLPTFWVTLALMLVLPVAPDADNSVARLLAQPLALVLLAGQEALPVGWTLVFEAHFYIIAALALCFGARASTVMLGWVPVQVVAVMLSAVGLLPALTFLQPISLELCAGLLIGTLAPRRPLPAPGLVAIGALALIAAVCALVPSSVSTQGVMRPLVLGIPAALLVYAVLSLDATGWRPPRATVWLGEISYSLYMWHIPVLIVLAAVMVGWMQQSPVVAVAYCVLGLVLSVVVAAAAYRWIEAPVVRWVSALTRREPRVVHAAP